VVQVGVEVLLHDKEAYGECLQLYKQLFAKQKKFVSSIQFYVYVCICIVCAVCVYVCTCVLYSVHTLYLESNVVLVQIFWTS